MLKMFQLKIFGLLCFVLLRAIKCVSAFLNDKWDYEIWGLISRIMLFHTRYRPEFKKVLFFSAQIKLFVTGLFSLNHDISLFKDHLRDFLVQIKVSCQYQA